MKSPNLRLLSERWSRGPAFSPESDSSVRTRFLALRKKLDEYYANEGRDAPVRLDIPRGTYTLRFVPNTIEMESSPGTPSEVVIAPLTEPVNLPPTVETSPSHGRFWLAVLTVVLGLAGAAAASAVLRPNADAKQHRLLVNAWGSMLDRGSSVTIAIGTPASFFVRDFGNAEPPVGDPNYRLSFKRDSDFESWYSHTRNTTLAVMRTCTRMLIRRFGATRPLPAS